MKRTVSDLLQQKGTKSLPLVEEDASVDQALAILANIDAGALLVMNKENAVVGIFSERDFVRSYSASGGAPGQKLRVRELMSRRVVFVTADYRLDECMSVMAEMRIRHLPVLHEGTPIAFLSMRDIMEALVEENQFMLSQLITYITGSNRAEEARPRSGFLFV